MLFLLRTLPVFGPGIGRCVFGGMGSGSSTVYICTSVESTHTHEEGFPQEFADRWWSLDRTLWGMRVTVAVIFPNFPSIISFAFGESAFWIGFGAFATFVLFFHNGLTPRATYFTTPILPLTLTTPTSTKLQQHSVSA